MIKRFKSYKEKSASQALIVVLMAVTLLSIIIVGFLLTASLHRSISRQDYQAQVARAMAVTGLNSAVTQIRTALGPWDDPFNNFCGGTATNAPPTFYWSDSPGIITRWSYSSVTPQTNYPLFSLPAYGDTSLANLNVPSADGVYPIIGGANPPAIQVYWANVLQNPSLAPASTNRIIGRYAFWVDDESAKININTADGTKKYQTSSLGLGTPSEVSLQALQQGGAPVSATLATNIVYVARTTGFNSIREILRAPASTQDLFTNNVFNLTTCSRSPDLNLFGQPKMAMMPILGDAGLTGLPWLPGTNMLVNAITLQPAREIYPTPSQLPPYTWVDPLDSSSHHAPWPLTFRQLFGPFTTGSSVALGLNDREYLYALPNYPYINGMMLAQYMAGTNSMGQAVTWPSFPGSSTTGFAGKYTQRQIDSIVAQVTSLGAKDISPDFTYSQDTTGEGSSWMAERGKRAITTPLLVSGWLSGKWVSGVGRTPKVDSLLMEYDTYGSVGQTNNLATYTPPRVNLDIWLEWWLPAAYLGGNNVIPTGAPGNNSTYVGGGYNYGVNPSDRPSTPEWWHLLNPPQPSTALPPPPFYPWPPSSIPKSDYTSSSYWGNQLLTDNQGLDFTGNPNGVQDPDQGLATQYHNPYALSTNFTWSSSWNPPLYVGADGAYTTGYEANTSFFLSPFILSNLQLYNATTDWAQGELRCVRSSNGSLIPMPMQPSADGTTLTIGGGVVFRSTMMGGNTSDLDPVPLDSIRGNSFGPSGDNSGNMGGYFDGETWASAANVAGIPSGTVRDLAIAAVVPTSFSMSIPHNGELLSYTKYILARVADPLVNKFPGDWVVTNSDSVPSTTMEYGAATTYNYSSYDEYSSGFHAGLASTVNGIAGDPDSYWMPQADCGISYLNDLASQTLIPRSARMPNIGYLQYLRTGIIPDDETQAYQTEHGAPFRLLSYAPSTETAHQKTTLGTSSSYPDWALLDLLYVPSILAPYGGPYGYYDTNSPPVWQGYGNPGVLANYSTSGGSTPGRINPNGAVIYTTNTTTPLPGVSRTAPMQAVLQGLSVNQSLNPISLGATPPNPGLTGGTSVDASTIAQAVYAYLTNNGPLRMPAELCNVPEIAALRPSVNATRNDLIRQIIGNLTTQSNVFSVWTVGQTIMKAPSNTSYGTFEAGDSVLAETRLHFVVERYLDPGADGIYGNSSSAGTDGIVGTYDDPVDPVNHPYCPRYLYRVIGAEEVR